MTSSLWIYRVAPFKNPYIWSNLLPEDDAVFAHLTLGHGSIYEDQIPALQAVAKVHGFRVIEADPAQVTEKASLPAEEYWKKK